MAFSNDDLNYIFDRTTGRCHICRDDLDFSAYGESPEFGGWEVDHSVPRAKGGTD